MGKLEWGGLIVLLIFFLRTWWEISKLREDTAVTREWVRQIHDALRPEIRANLAGLAAVIDESGRPEQEKARRIAEVEAEDKESGEIEEAVQSKLEREW